MTNSRRQSTKNQASNLDDVRISTFGKLLEVNAKLERLLGRQLEDAVGLPFTWFEVMLRITRSDDQVLTMTTLADQVVLTTGGVTRLVDRIEAAGFIERVACPTDRRVNWLKVTSAGMVALDEAVEAHLEHLETEFVGRLKAADMKNLSNALDSLHESLDQGDKS